MAEELQSLLERIQKDGLDKAQSESSAIVETAKQKAAKLIADAGQQAAALLKKAEEDSGAFAVRAEQTIQQAARDVVLYVRDNINNALEALVRKDVATALDPSTIIKLLDTVVGTYCKNADGGSIEVLLPADLKDQIADHFTGRLDAEMRKGLEIKADKTIAAGFRVSIVDQQVEHDFTDQAISDAICRLLRPRISKIVTAAAAKKS